MECVVQNSDRLTAKNVRHRVTRIFIDDFVYEPLLVERADFAKYAKSSDALDILRTGETCTRAFQDHCPRDGHTDYGPSARKNTDGSEDRTFYLWKKEKPFGSEPAPQYLVSTLVDAEVVIMSFIPAKG
jgi:hypothetical protein